MRRVNGGGGEGRHHNNVNMFNKGVNNMHRIEGTINMHRVTKGITIMHVVVEGKY